MTVSHCCLSMTALNPAWPSGASWTSPSRRPRRASAPGNASRIWTVGPQRPSPPTRIWTLCTRTASGNEGSGCRFGTFDRNDTVLTAVWSLSLLAKYQCCREEETGAPSSVPLGWMEECASGMSRYGLMFICLDSRLMMNSLENILLFSDSGVCNEEPEDSLRWRLHHVHKEFSLPVIWRKLLPY